MKVDLEERKRKQEVFDEEERAMKDKKVYEQHKLKSMMDNNAKEAREKMDERNTLIKKMPDYNDHNVFSYIFEPKIH